MSLHALPYGPQSGCTKHMHRGEGRSIGGLNPSRGPGGALRAAGSIPSVILVALLRRRGPPRSVISVRSASCRQLEPRRTVDASTRDPEADLVTPNLRMRCETNVWRVLFANSP